METDYKILSSVDAKSLNTSGISNKTFIERVLLKSKYVSVFNELGIMYQACKLKYLKFDKIDKHADSLIDSVNDITDDINNKLLKLYKFNDSQILKDGTLIISDVYDALLKDKFISEYKNQLVKKIGITDEAFINAVIDKMSDKE